MRRVAQVPPSKIPLGIEKLVAPTRLPWYVVSPTKGTGGMGVLRPASEAQRGDLSCVTQAIDRPLNHGSSKMQGAPGGRRTLFFLLLRRPCVFFLFWFPNGPPRRGMGSLCALGTRSSPHHDAPTSCLLPCPPPLPLAHVNQLTPTVGASGA